MDDRLKEWGIRFPVSPSHHYGTPVTGGEDNEWRDSPQCFGNRPGYPGRDNISRII